MPRKPKPNPVIEQIINQHRDEPGLVGSLATVIGNNDAVAQQHRDGRTLDVHWRDRVSHLRCTIYVEPGSEDCIAQIDIHRDGTIRVESHEAISVQIDPALKVLVLVRYASAVEV